MITKVRQARICKCCDWKIKTYRRIRNFRPQLYYWCSICQRRLYLGEWEWTDENAKRKEIGKW